MIRAHLYISARGGGEWRVAIPSSRRERGVFATQRRCPRPSAPTRKYSWTTEGVVGLVYAYAQSIAGEPRSAESLIFWQNLWGATRPGERMGDVLAQRSGSKV